MTQGGKTLQKVGPKLIRGAIEDVYQTPFRLLGKLGKKKVYRVKTKTQKVCKIITIKLFLIHFMENRSQTKTSYTINVYMLMKTEQEF